MINTIYLVRHAKAKQESYDNQDRSRELNPRGMRDSGLIGQYLIEKKVKPDMIISSPAERALTTAQILATQLRYNSDKIHLNEELYFASARTFLLLVNQLKDDWKSVIIAGHNPVITYFGEYISEAEISNMPTCAVLTIVFDCDWESVSKGSGRMIDYVTPKMLKQR